MHGKKDGVDKLVASFQAEYPAIAQVVSKTQTRKRITEIADKEKHVDGHGTVRWVCKKEFLDAAQAATGVEVSDLVY